MQRQNYSWEVVYTFVSITKQYHSVTLSDSEGPALHWPSFSDFSGLTVYGLYV